MSEFDRPLEFVCFRDDGSLGHRVDLATAAYPLVAARPLRRGQYLGVLAGTFHGGTGPARGVAPLDMACAGAAYIGVATRDYSVGEVVVPSFRVPGGG